MPEQPKGLFRFWFNSYIAPLLVRNDSPGLPTSVKLAVEKSNFRKAGVLSMAYELEFSLLIGGDPPPLATDHIRIDILKLIPNTIRGIAVFGTAAMYSTLLTAGFRWGTFGKRLF